MKFGSNACVYFVPCLAEIRPRTEAMVDLLGIPYAVEISPCLAPTIAQNPTPTKIMPKIREV